MSGGMTFVSSLLVISMLEASTPGDEKGKHLFGTEQ
jgi:hypothetical protein